MTNYFYEKEKFISFKKVEELWSKNFRDTVVYLNNPFCKKNNCSYCCHKGYANPEDKEVQDFYFKHMPQQFDKYKNVIEKQNIKLVSFGGGTPNYLSAKDFDKYLNLLPTKLKEAKKIIELHPAYLTKEFINVLKKYNFDTLVFCIQTFDNKTLINQKRAVPDKPNLFHCFRYAKKLGFNIAVDLITYWTKKEEDYKILEKDLYLLKWLEPHEISISVLYQNKYYNENFNSLEVYKKIYTLTNSILTEYIPENIDLEDMYQCAPSRFFKKDFDRSIFDVYKNSLSCVPWEYEQGYSTLGIGSYKCELSDVYSVIGPNYVIYETNNQEYYLAKNYNFWDAIRKEIDRLEKLTGENEVPVGTGIVFTNVVENLGEFYKGFIQGSCKTNIIERQGVKSKLEEKITNNFFKLIN